MTDRVLLDRLARERLATRLRNAADRAVELRDELASLASVGVALKTGPRLWLDEVVEDARALADRIETS